MTIAVETLDRGISAADATTPGIRALTMEELKWVAGSASLLGDVLKGAAAGAGLAGGAAFGLSLVVAVAALSGGMAVPVMLVGGLIAAEAGAIAGGIAGFLDSTDH